MKIIENFKIAVDCVSLVYDRDCNEFKVLLTQRKNEPHKDRWALPGGFVRDETKEFDAIASSILNKETGIINENLTQLKSYRLTDESEKNRIVSILFFGLNSEIQDVSKGNQISKYFAIDEYPDLPFDHAKKIMEVMNFIKLNVNSKPFLFKFLPSKFSLNQLHRVYELLTDIKVDNRNFRRKTKRNSFIIELDEYENDVSRRPSKLYRFDPNKYYSSTSF